MKFFFRRCITEKLDNSLPFISAGASVVLINFGVFLFGVIVSCVIGWLVSISDTGGFLLFVAVVKVADHEALVIDVISVILEIFEI